MSGPPSDDDRIWQGVRRHLAGIEPLIPLSPAWRPAALADIARPRHKVRLLGRGALGGLTAVVAAVILVAALALGPLGSRPAGTPTPTGGPSWAGLRLDMVPTASAFGSDDAVETMIAWRGGFVAGGAARPSDMAGLQDQSAAIWWSTNGRSWSKASLDGGQGTAIRQVLAWDDRLLALGGPVFLPSCPASCLPSPPTWFWESNDGRSWTRLATDDTFLNPVESFDRPVITDLAADANGLVAVGGTGVDSPAIWTSPDGRAWQRVDLGAVMPHGELDAVAWAHGEFVAVGSMLDKPMQRPSDLVGAARQSVVLTSGDGRLWRSTTIEPPPALPLDRLSVGAAGVVIGATGCPTCATSSPFYALGEGGAWKPMSPSGPTDVDLVASDGQRIVSIRPDGGRAVAWQTQGSGGWQAIPVEGTFGPQDGSRLTLEAMAVGPGGLAVAGLVRVGNAWQARLWLATPVEPASAPTATSSSGSAWGHLGWQRVDLPDRGSGTSIASIVGWQGQGFLVGGSVNGAAGGIEAAIWTSLDGTAWRRVGEGTPGFSGARIVQILSTSTGLLALGDIPHTDQACLAPDKGAAYDPYVCPGSPAVLWRSPDGSTWTRLMTGASLEGATLRAVATADGRLVAVGYGPDPSTGAATSATWTSTDGTSWQRHTDGFADAQLNGVVATAGGYLAYGSTWPADAQERDPHTSAAIWFSPDGVTWQGQGLPPTGGGIDQAYAAAHGVLAIAEPCPPLSLCWGSGANLWSADGRTWATLPDGAIYEPFDSRTGVGAGFGSGGGRIVAGGGAVAGVVQITSDGDHWRDVPGSDGPDPTESWQVVGLGAGGLVVATAPQAGGPPSLWFAKAAP